MSSDSEIRDPDHNALNTKMDKTPLEAVENIAVEYFGVAGRASTLSSERDETFLVEARDGRRYVLKIANPSERMEVLRFQTEGMLHLAAKGLSLPLPEVVAAGDGSSLLILPFGERRIARMLTFLDGRQLHKAPRSAAQMHALGTALALLGKGLSDFRPDVPTQDLLWDICYAANLRSLVSHVEPPRRKLVLAALDGFDRFAAHAMTTLPRQVIHNDFNPHNILVSPTDPATVTGVIDFGDMVEAPLVNDLAVALSYQIGTADGIADAVTILRAYNAVRQLDRSELDHLPALLRTRLAMTVIITEWRAGLHPENRDYILRNHPIALAGLNRLADDSDADLGAFFRQKIGDFT